EGLAVASQCLLDPGLILIHPHSPFRYTHYTAKSCRWRISTALHLGHRGGVPIKGCSSRFGLVHVDFDTQRRTIKRSGQLEICRAGAASGGW
ncbi:MAG: hypothetical protein ACE5II_05010, partial [Anaerolineae bacterium]